MATYALDKYGLATFGFTALVEYDAEPFIAESLDHGQLTLRWNPPQGNYDRLRLVRNAYGNPIDADDGVVLLDQAKADAVQAHLDTALPDGAFFYYSLFVAEPVGLGWVWRRVADTFGLVAKEHGYGRLLLDRLPSVFTTHAHEVGAHPDQDTTLARFLGLFGYELDVIRTTLDSLLVSKDPDKIPGPLLPMLAAQIGQPYEPALGQAQNRRLIRNSIYLYKTKGTEPALTGLATSLTGWDAQVLPYTNLLLESDDSSAERSTGQWRVVSGPGSLSRRSNDVAGPGGYGPTSLLAYRTTQDDIPYAGMFEVTATAAGRVELRLPAGGIGNGIPVTSAALVVLPNLLFNSSFEGTSLTDVSAYSVVSGVTPTVTRDTTTSWRGSASVLATPGAVNNGFIHQCPLSEVVTANTKVVGSAYVKGVAGQVLSIAARFRSPAGAHLGESSGSRSYTMTGEWQRISTFAWTHNADFVPALQIKVVSGTTPFNVDATQIVVGEALSDYAPRPDEYVFSARFRDRGTHRQPRLAVAWYDRLGALLSTTAEQAGATTNTDDWTCQLTLPVVAPAGARYAQPIIVWPVLAAGEVQLFDAVQFEAGTGPTRFRPSRQIVLELEPDRRNLATNPTFHVDTAGWTATSDNAVARYTDIPHTGTAAMRVTAGTLTDADQLNLVPLAQARVDTITGFTSHQSTTATISRTTTVTRRGDGALQATTAASGTFTFFNVGPSQSQPFSAGPVVEGKTYVARAFFRAATVGRPVRLHAQWINSANAVIGTVMASSTGTGVSSTTTGWTEQRLTTGAAPAGATRLFIYATVYTSALNETHYYDDFAVWESAAIAGADTTTSSTIGRARTAVALEPLQTYTASLWVYGPAGTYAVSLSSGYASAAVQADTWTQLSVVHTAGAAETNAVLTVAGPPDAVYRVDDVLVERGLGVRSYFDGSTTSGETGWLGTAHASESVLYRQRVIRDDRLRHYLPKYLPVGNAFDLQYADGFRVSTGDLAAS